MNVSTRSLAIASVAISTVALIVGLGGAAISATGGNFVLGVINSASNQSGIVSPVNGKMLLLNNTSTDANATALGLTVKSGHPPMVVNSDVKVPQLNSDELDGLDSTEFSRIFAFKANVHLPSITLAAGDQFVLSPAFVPALSGRCLVAVEGQVNFAALNTGFLGPYFRAAAKLGAAPAVTDGVYGHYFPIVSDPDGYSEDQTRVSTFEVTAGVPTQFGAFFGDVAAASNWVGRPADVNLTYFCSTVGSVAGALAKASSGDARSATQ